jgi:hypothetical protein
VVTLPTNALKTGEYITITGNPGGDGSIQAAMIQILPSSSVGATVTAPPPPTSIQPVQSGQ